ncbi:MAG: YMGG-like glycine zipper-containing protein [Ferruginibacter sp.]
MKKILIVFAMSTFFFACKNKGTNNIATDKNAVLTDTALLRRSGLLSDTARISPVVTNKIGTTTTSSTTTTTTTTTTSNGDPNKSASSSNKVVGTKSTTHRRPASNTASTGNYPSNSGNTATIPVPVKKDRALSDAAIGTAIGAGSGAILGAVVSKDKVKGAVIGGVIGGAGGYAVGRSRDVKSGRVARKKNQ